MEKQINERFIVFAGSKAGGSQRLPIPQSVVIEENKDIVVSIGSFSVVYNCIKEELFKRTKAGSGLRFCDSRCEG